MKLWIIGAAAALTALAATTSSASAQTGARPADAPFVVAQAAQTDDVKPARRSRSKSTTSAGEKKEPTVGQMAGRERQRKCGAEWREAKKAGKVAEGTKWPKFLSQCIARLKGNSA